MAAPDCAPAEAILPLHRNGRYVLLWSGAAVSAVGTQVSSVAYPLLALEVTGSATRTGLIATVALVGAALVRLPAGALVDRWDRRKIMIGSDLVRGVALGSIAVAALVSELTYAQLLIVALVEACGGVLYRPAATAAVRRVVRTDQVKIAVAADEARTNTASLLGPPLGGALYGLSRTLPFVVDAASYVYSLLAAVCIRTPLRPDRGAVRTSLRRDIFVGLKWINVHRVIRWILLVAAATNFLIAAVELATIVIARQHGASSAEIGLMLGIASAGGVIGAVAAPFVVRRVSALGLIRGLTWISAATLPIMAARPTVWVLGAMMACRLLVAPMANTVLVGYQVQHTPDELQGRVAAAAYLLAGLAAPLGPMTAGLLLASTTATWTLIVLGAVAVAIAISTLASRTAHQLGEPSSLDQAAETKAPR